MKPKPFHIGKKSDTGVIMYRKFFKLLIIGNPQPTILHIPNRNNGIMEWWNNRIAAFHTMICQGKSGAKTNGPLDLRRRRLFAHASQGRHPIIPIFQHSIIPVVSAAN